MTNLKTLLAIAGDAIAPDIEAASFAANLNESAVAMVCARNGFYAFEGALLVRPLEDTQHVRGLKTWNSFEQWQFLYAGLGIATRECTFFAENIFGEQFFLKGERVGILDPETGACEEFAVSLDEWAGKILADSDYWTGFPLAHKWQEINGRIPDGFRLIPKIPFVLQGAFEASNLVAKPELEAILIRAQLAAQLANKKDGETIVFSVAH